MSNKIVYIEGANSITVSLDGKVIPVGKGHVAYNQVLTAIRDGDFATLRTLLTPRAEMVRLSQGRLLLENGVLTADGRVLNDAFANRIMNMLKDGGNVEPMFTFLANLEENPSFRARNETVGFIEACGLPFTDDGHFIAYKLVSRDFKDIYTGTMDNSVGATPTMPRNMVDEDANRTCSEGLHFASKEYIRKGGYADASGARLVAVKVNPRDVVAIPTDYNNSKGRACQYLILEELAFDAQLEINSFGYGLDESDDEADDAEDGPEQDADASPVARPASVKISDDVARKFLRAMDNKATLTSACAIAGISRRDGARIRDREGRWAGFTA